MRVAAFASITEELRELFLGLRNSAFGARRPRPTHRNASPLPETPDPIPMDTKDIEDQGQGDEDATMEEAAPKSGALLGVSSLVGYLDRVDRGSLQGWVLDRDTPETPVKVGIWFKGVCVHVALADLDRPDLAEIFGTGGRHGFAFVCPTELRDVDVLDIEAIPVDTPTPLPKVEQVLLLHGARLAETGAPHPGQTPSSGALWRTFRHSPPEASPATGGSKIGIVIVSRDSSERLERLLASFERHNSYKAIKFFVAAHASIEESREICARWAANAPVAFVDRRITVSAAESSNYAARLAQDCDLLVFMNTDIELCADPLPQMVDFMEQEDCGALGVRLRTRVKGPDGADTCLDYLGIALDDCAAGASFRPYNILVPRPDGDPPAGAWETPAIGREFMMVRRSEFWAIGGFDEDYFAGYEDIDFCLRLRQRLAKRIFCMTGVCVTKQIGAFRSPRRGGALNTDPSDLRRLEQRAGALVRSETIADMFRRSPLMRSRPTHVAFAVTTADMEAEAGDYFTAFELGAELNRLYGWHVSYLELSRWRDLDYFDIVVAMRHDFDLMQIRSANPHLVLVAWVRNWCDAWLSNPQTHKYDQVWASSAMSAHSLGVRLGRQIPVIRIATNGTRFGRGEFCSSLRSDYCFTGSYFETHRDIITAVDPKAVPFEFAVYGHNWEKVPELANYSRGPLSYERMPDVYASTRIVIDDSNHTTVKWGSLNSRVFDALAGGALVLTNNVIGSDETFGGLLPTWSSRDQLTELLLRYLGDEQARRALVDTLRTYVLQRHSYAHRAQEAHEALSDLIRVRRRVGIEIAAPSYTPEAGAIVDAIAAAVDRQGFLRARREIGGRTAEDSGAGDDFRILIAAPGLAGKTARLREDQVNILIALGSLDNIAPAELDRFDLLFVADRIMAEALSGRARAPVFSLFDEPGAMARYAVRFDEISGSITLIDSYRLQVEVAQLISRRAELCASLLSAKREIRDRSSRKSRDHAKGEAAALQSARLVFFPDYRQTNPYQRLLYGGLDAALTVGPGAIGDAIALLESGVAVVVFHLHWTSVILGLGGVEEEVRRRRDAFLRTLDRFLALGGRLFWTIHNRLSHETPFPDIEMELYRELALRAAAVLVHSPSAPALLADFVQPSPERLLVVEHGNYIGAVPDRIDRAEARRRLELGGTATTFLFFGQLRSYKGIEALLDAFDALPEGSAAELIVAGMPGGGGVAADPGPIRARLAHTPGVSAHLEFIPDDDAQVYFRAADVVTLPYRAVLTSGSAILALSFGKPVIAPALGLIADLIRDGEEGLLYDPDQPDGLVRAMRRFLDLDASGRARMGAAARDRAEGLSWKRAGRTLYLEALAGAVGTPQILGAGESGLRCFVRRGTIANNHVALSILHEADVGKTSARVAEIIGRPEASFGVLVVSMSENPLDFAALSDKFPSATVIQAPLGTSHDEGGRLALAVAKQDGRRYLGIAGVNVAFDSSALARIMASADQSRCLRVFSPGMEYDGRGCDEGAIGDLAEMTLTQASGFACDCITATRTEALRAGSLRNMLLCGPVDEFDALFADRPQAMAQAHD